jgi:hypothetical protein
MKQIKLAIALLIFLLASMVIVPFVNAAPDIVASANTNHDANLVSVDQATSVATQFVNAISSSNPKFADWKGAFVKKETTYYDMAGKYSAYSYEVMVNGQYDGYIITSATRENYPVLEFSKGKTPNSEITTQNTVKSLATTTAVSRQVTLGEGKPIYLGGSFYFMQYPIQKTGISKTKVQSTQDTILVDMTEERVVPQDNAIKTASMSISSANQANIGLDEKNISQNVNHRKQDVQAAWNAIDKITDTASPIKSESVAASASYNYQKTISDVPMFYWEHGCSPTSSAMVLGYWRNLGLTRLPDDDGINTITLLPNGDPLNQALATEMGTGSFLGQEGWTWPWMIAHGIGRVINNAGYPYISSSAVDTLLSWPMIQSEIDANRPFVLSVFSINFSTLSFWGHSYAVVGYGYDSWLSTKYIEVYTTWPDDPHKYITFFSWDGAMNTYVRPEYAYTITSSAGPNGKIDPEGVVNAPTGTNKTYTITPYSGYVIDQILVDDNPVTLNPYPFEDIVSDHTINVTFAQASSDNLMLTTGYSEHISGSGKIVTINTSTFTWDGIGHVYLTGGDEYSNADADDAFDVYTDDGNLTFASPYLAVYQGIPDITSLCKPGENHLTLNVRDIWGHHLGCGETWLYFDHGLNKTAVPLTIPQSYLSPEEELLRINATNTTGINTV